MKHPPQESDLVPGRTIATVAAGVVVASAIGVLAAYAIRRASARELAGGAPPARPHVPAEVNAMEAVPFSVEAQGLDMNRRAAAYLASYGWIDRERGLVHIPIEAAFEVVLARRGGKP